MMKHTGIICAFIVFMSHLVPALASEGNPAWQRSAAEDDSLGKFTMLGAKLDEYFHALETEPSGIQKAEVDFIIGACTDSLVRQFTAIKAYGFFLNSPVMGNEAVAIHIFDNWFGNGKVAMKNEADFLNARLFATVNRRSQIGCKAPELALEDMDGNKSVLFANTRDRYSLLLFYDTDCPKCRLEIMKLDIILKNKDYPLNFYAVYIGTDRKEWEKYVTEYLAIGSGNTAVFNFHDPDRLSDFTALYGILQTPGIFMISPENRIIGRKMDAEAVEKMSDAIFSPKEMEYGSEESVRLFDEIFGIYGDSLSCSDITGIAAHIKEKTLEEAGDTTLYKQMTGDLLYYLSNRKGPVFKCGGNGVAEIVLSEGDIWKSSDDSIKVLSLAGFMKDMYSKSAIGTRIADIEVPSGEIITAEGCRKKDMNLAKLKGKRNLIIFHTEGCDICAAEIEAAEKLAAGDRKTRIYLVNMDEVLSGYPETADKLFMNFDLTSLPFIIETDRKGTVTGKYLSLCF